MGSEIWYLWYITRPKGLVITDVQILRRYLLLLFCILGLLFMFYFKSTKHSTNMLQCADTNCTISEVELAPEPELTQHNPTLPEPDSYLLILTKTWNYESLE